MTMSLTITISRSLTQPLVYPFKKETQKLLKRHKNSYYVDYILKTTTIYRKVKTTYASYTEIQTFM